MHPMAGHKDYNSSYKYGSTIDHKNMTQSATQPNPMTHTTLDSVMKKFGKAIIPSSSKLQPSKKPYKICLQFFTGKASLSHQQYSHQQTLSSASSKQHLNVIQLTNHKSYYSLICQDIWQLPGIATETSST